jgi:hypothetical protein
MTPEQEEPTMYSLYAVLLHRLRPMSFDNRMYNYHEILNGTFLPLASFDSYNGALIIEARCWEDAQIDVGKSNLLACSPSDKCSHLKSIRCLLPLSIIWESCPSPDIQKDSWALDTNDFRIDTRIQRCRTFLEPKN